MHKSNFLQKKAAMRCQEYSKKKMAPADYELTLVFSDQTCEPPQENITDLTHSWAIRK
jgi:hypothetical protein